MSIKEAQAIVNDWIESTGKGYFAPVTNVAVLAEEVGELAHIVLRSHGEQKAKAGDDTSHEALAGELADVLWVTLALANQLDVDMTEAFTKTLRKRQERDKNRF